MLILIGFLNNLMELRWERKICYNLQLCMYGNNQIFQVLVNETFPLNRAYVSINFACFQLLWYERRWRNSLGVYNRINVDVLYEIHQRQTKT